MTARLTASVGKRGVNRPHDVASVQLFLNNWITFGALKGRVALLRSGVVCDEGMIQAIGVFQQFVAGMRNPDYRIDPNGRTWKALTGPVTDRPAAGGPAPMSHRHASRISGWAIYQVRQDGKLLEIDVEPAMVQETEVARLVFRAGAVPAGVTLSSTLYSDFERWRVEANNAGELLNVLNGPFQRFVVLRHEYGIGWQQRVRRERIEQTRREVHSVIWSITPQDRFGGYSFAEFRYWKPGAHEITGKGFVWIGQVGGQMTVQFHPVFGWDVANQDVRWCLERGASLAEAIGLHVRQWQRINLQMLGGFAVAIADVAPNLTGNATAGNLDKIVQTTGVATANDIAPTPSYRHAFQAATQRFASHPDERRLQELGKRTPVPIVAVPSRR